ncbi:MAG: DHH family phosphoesterase [Clostridia bacterium]|nr:DHH family phosphoesterase [Clostridia bacterium]
MACKKISLLQTARFLKRNDHFVILTHASPDGDTLGSACALAMGLQKIGKRAYVVCPDPVPKKFDYFMKKLRNRAFKYKNVIAVDIADEALLGSLKDEFGGKVNLCIDHHVSNTGYAENLFLDASASATAECVFAILKVIHAVIDDTIAAALYTGISTDTGCFKYSNVTARTFDIAGRLFAYNINAAEINRIMFDTKSKNRLEMEKLVLDTAEFHFDEKCMILSVTEEIQKKTKCSGSELEGVAAISRSVEGVLAGVTIKESEKNVFKISLRTYEPLDAANICGRLGGGGHRAAAGCTVNGSLDEVKEKILASVKQELEEANAGAYTD